MSVPALVLTAGLATRLRPLSYVRAKAALPVAGVPLVQRILRWLAGHGVTDAVLNLHHLPHTITSLVGDGSVDGVRVRYSWETPVLGSAGGPRHALSLLAASPFLIVNGDTLTNVDVGAVIDAHRRSGALVTMAVIPNTQPDKYGGVLIEGDVVRGFSKPGSRERSFHFIGVQVAEADVFAGLTDGVPAESTRELYPALMAAQPGSVRAVVSDAEFFDIGTPADYLSTCLRFGVRGSGFAVRFPDCVVWDDVEVAADARLRRCILTDGVRIPSGATWEDMTIRVAHGELMQNERLVGELAIGPIDGTARG